MLAATQTAQHIGYAKQAVDDEPLSYSLALGSDSLAKKAKENVNG